LETPEAAGVLQGGMPAQLFRHLALTEPMCAWIDVQVAKREDPSTSDLIRTDIRVLRTQVEGKGSVESPPPTRRLRSSGQA
jgi:antitoxin ParD1/3/4